MHMHIPMGLINPIAPRFPGVPCGLKYLSERYMYATGALCIKQLNFRYYTTAAARSFIMPVRYAQLRTLRIITPRRYYTFENVIMFSSKLLIEH